MVDQSDGTSIKEWVRVAGDTSARRDVGVGKRVKETAEEEKIISGYH